MDELNFLLSHFTWFLTPGAHGLISFGYGGFDNVVTWGKSSCSSDHSYENILMSVQSVLSSVVDCFLLW